MCASSTRSSLTVHTQFLMLTGNGSSCVAAVGFKGHRLMDVSKCLFKEEANIHQS